MVGGWVGRSARRGCWVSCRWVAAPARRTGAVTRCVFAAPGLSRKRRKRELSPQGADKEPSLTSWPGDDAVPKTHPLPPEAGWGL